MTARERISAERWAIAAFIGAIAACLAVPATVALRIPPAFGVPIGLLAGIACAFAAAPRLPTAWDGALVRHRWLCGLWLLLALFALARTAGVALFMADANQPWASAMWFDDFYIRHNCFSAWWKAAHLAREGVENIYASDPYAGFEGRFKLDDFLYMPQFLILPLAGVATGADFLQLRAIWFTLEGVLVAVAMLALCGWIGGTAARRAALLIPAVWVATPVLLTLQLGNFQLAGIAMAVLAMILFERDRPAAGGALLGFAVFKIFPAVLCGYLLFARRWRALAWTIAFSLAYSVVAWLAMGAKPFDTFVHYELPRIVDGEAWTWLENEGLEAVVAINDSVPGMVLKLKQVGVPGMSHAVEGELSWLWTAVVIALTVLAALRRNALSHLERATTWLALLALAAFRSPFVPDTYGLFPVIWLWSLLAAAALPRARNVVVIALLWLAFAAVLPFSGVLATDLQERLALSTLSQCLAIGVCIWVLLCPPARARAEDAESLALRSAPA